MTSTCVVFQALVSHSQCFSFCLSNTWKRHEPRLYPLMSHWHCSRLPY